MNKRSVNMEIVHINSMSLLEKQLQSEENIFSKSSENVRAIIQLFLILSGSPFKLISCSPDEVGEYFPMYN